MASLTREAAPEPTLLLGIDLEDNRHGVPGGERLPERVPEMTRRYLSFFARFGARTTFFAVGAVARQYPELLREIVAAGHEVACHTDAHEPLDRHTPESLREDLKRARDACALAGAEAIIGFRAPVLSLTQSTEWVYEVLAREGFRYSSSVLPRRNPLYGWPEFGDAPRTMHGILEIPVSILPGPLGLPFASGVYLRMIPGPIVSLAARRLASRGGPLVGYLHPFDIDDAQERFPHPGVEDSKFYNWLMYYNRSSVFEKLGLLLESGFRVESYAAFLERSANGNPELQGRWGHTN